ncbi:MAG: AraC family transcriptional regulator [Algoriphagus sp.]|nr:AraC family transcriptional regulator [Algoriphagus sp.]
MLLTLDWKNLLYLIGQIIGFLVGLLLLTYGFRKNKSNQLIGASFIFLTLASLLAWFISSGLMIHFPNLYRTGNIFALLYIPMVYLYIRKIVKEEPIGWIDLLQLIPALIYVIDFTPVFLLSYDEKLDLIRKEINNSLEFMAFNQSQFFPKNFWVSFRTLMILVYWLLSVNLLVKYQSKIADINRFFGKEWVIWMKIYLFFQLLLVLPILILFFSVSPTLYYDLIHIPSALLIASSGVAILFFPKVLYGMNEFEYLLDSQEEKETEEEQPQLSVEKIAEIKEKLIVLEAGKKFYQAKGYAIRDLAKDTGIPSYLLTIYINRVLETNFSDFINERRIEECARLMEEGSFTHFTLEGLAETCGFSNRNSFLNSFKKYKGITPSAFKKTLKESDSEA